MEFQLLDELQFDTERGRGGNGDILSEQLLK